MPFVFSSGYTIISNSSLGERPELKDLRRSIAPHRGFLFYPEINQTSDVVTCDR